MATESTDAMPLFPPLPEDVPIETLFIFDSGHPLCHHKLDNPSLINNNNTMTSSVTTDKEEALQQANTTTPLAHFWDRYDKYNWSNCASSNNALVAAVTEFVAASKDVINFPDCKDVRRLLVPVFLTKADEAKKDPRLIARTIMEMYGLKKNIDVDPSSSSSSSSVIITDERSDKKGQPTPKKEKGKGVKLRNFTKEEHLLLSKAYVRVSLDPIRGNDQKSQDFWANVFRVFVALYKAEAEVQEESMADRNPDSIRSRFQRNIQKDVIEFCAICRTNELKSGESQDDFFVRMDHIFEQKKNKAFRFRHCMPILQEIPKFDWETTENTNIDELAEDFLNDSIEVVTKSDRARTPEQKSLQKSSFVNNASTLKRPQGAKAAKRKVVENYVDGKVEEKKIWILQDVAAGLNDMADAIQKKQYREHLQAMLMIHQSLGNHQQMLNYLQKLESLTIEPVQHPSNPGNMPEVITLDNVNTSPDVEAMSTQQNGEIVIATHSGKKQDGNSDGTQDGHSNGTEDTVELDKELENIIQQTRE